MKENEAIKIKKGGRREFERLGAFIQERISKSRYGFGELLKAGAAGGRKLKKPFSYIETFIEDAGVAAIHPSSKYLVARVVRAVEKNGPRVVVEFGAAEGVMTKKILKGLPHDGRLVAIERNAGFYKSLAEFHDTRLRSALGDVRDMKKILAGLGVEKADCFVSGIPFSFLSPGERSSLIREIYGHLSHGGRFVAYQCTTHLIPLLRAQFQQLEVELEIRNMPPHFVFTAVKR
jgi:phospholipid N-methyltransferase